MSATRIRLWLVKQTDKARLYSKFNPVGRGATEPDNGDLIWVPLSIIEHVTKRGSEHEVTLPDWFIEKNGL